MRDTCSTDFLWLTAITLAMQEDIGDSGSRHMFADFMPPCIIRNANCFARKRRGGRDIHLLTTGRGYTTTEPVSIIGSDRTQKGHAFNRAEWVVLCFRLPNAGVTFYRDRLNLTALNKYPRHGKLLLQETRHHHHDDSLSGAAKFASNSNPNLSEYIELLVSETLRIDST